MTGTRGGLGRIVAMVIGLAVLLLLMMSGEARAGQYSVVSCGWFVGPNAAWADTTGGAKFAPDDHCVPPTGSDPFATAQVVNWTIAAGTVSGTRFARWRWQAPAGTGFVGFRALWWHVLRDGFQQRLGTDPGNGDFVPFAIASASDATPREITAGFAPQAAFEDRLLCAKPETSFCSLAEESWDGLKAITLTLEDDSPPAAAIGGPLLEPGWHRGPVPVVFWSGELGGGVQTQEVSVDGSVVARTDYPCALILADGGVRGTTMQPCPLGPSGGATIDTSRFSDGPHAIRTCSWDIAGNGACGTDGVIAVDNTPPSHPGAVAITGGEGWHRVNRFDLAWKNPDQGPASPIVGARYRVTGTNGYDSGVRSVDAAGVATIAGVTVPGDGAWNLHLWLRDEAGNESAASGIDVPLRFDDVPPTVAFPDGEITGGQLTATIADGLAGPVGGTLSYRRAEATGWTDLPTKFHADGPNQGTLDAPLPDLPAGTWVFRAEASDAAGNLAASSLHADGTQMSIRVTAGQAGGKAPGHPAADGGAAAARRAKTRLFVRLRGGHGKSGAVTAPFGASALLVGRLTSAAGAGLAGHRIKVVARPSHGALAPRTVDRVTTGKRGGFALRLDPGTSRRISVSFAGSAELAPARHRPLDLRVRSGMTLAAAPTSLHTGQAVRLSGRVRSRGASIPRRGKLVAIQYLEAETGRWRPVLVTRTDHDGRFHARYRFRYVSGAARIRLRATALAEERWPFAPGSSAPVTVTVEGL
jgi:hypothetical protein